MGEKVNNVEFVLNIRYEVLLCEKETDINVNEMTKRVKQVRILTLKTKKVQLMKLKVKKNKISTICDIKKDKKNKIGTNFDIKS